MIKLTLLDNTELYIESIKKIVELKQRKPQPPPGALISFNGQRLKANDDLKKIGKIQIKYLKDAEAFPR